MVIGSRKLSWHLLVDDGGLFFVVWVSRRLAGALPSLMLTGLGQPRNRSVLFNDGAEKPDAAGSFPTDCSQSNVKPSLV
jgi:hypothetical protein